MEFDDFIRAYLKAIADYDEGFLKAVYEDWFASSGVVKGLDMDGFLRAAKADLKQFEHCRPEGKECFDDFCIAKLKGPFGAEHSLSFRRKGDGWGYFDERSNLARFNKVYAIAYHVEGKGGLRIMFGGRRTPAVRDIEGDTSGFVSMINSALEKGGNEITLLPLGGEIGVSVRISSGVQGGIMDTSAGDALSWQGRLKGPLKLRFEAE